jgi:hypothetical protein
VAEDRDRWLAAVNVIINLRVSTRCGEFLDSLRNG